jgi:hypothetical protein
LPPSAGARRCGLMVGVGSGYNTNARLLARHLTNHIPGNPSIMVQNQPGARTLTMTNQLYAAGPFEQVSRTAPGTVARVRAALEQS